MSRRPFAPLSPTARARAAILCLALLIPAAADAGIGDMMKKAKDKVTGKKPVEAAPVDEKVVFDDVVLELTGERLDHLLAAFDKARAINAPRPGLVEKLNKAGDERQAIDEKHGEKVRDLQRKRGDVEVCYHDGYSEAESRRLMEYKDKALTDPVILQKYQKAAAENNAAAAAGDSAALARINAVFKEVASPTREDSANVRKKCGPIPARLPEEIRMEQLDKEMASINQQIYEIDRQVAKAQSEQGGLTEQQWGMAIERIQMYLSATSDRSAKSSDSSGKSSKGSSGGSGSGSGAGSGVPAVRGFTTVEVEALEARLERLRAALGWT